MGRPAAVICPQSGKVHYATRLEAQAARAEWRKQMPSKARQRKRVDIPEEIYPCVHCDGFHLTKKFRKGR